MASNFIVCGWHTPDYQHWLAPLRASLDRFALPHDFVEVPKVVDQWEANTMRKPHEVAKALTRHPDKVVIFVDVDCVIHGPLDELASIRGDVAFYVRTKYRRNGGMRFGTREILAAMAPIEGREPTKVIVRIELAAAFLATACSAAYDSAGPIGSPDSGPDLYAVTEALVVKRAREIYGQGRG